MIILWILLSILAGVLGVLVLYLVFTCICSLFISKRKEYNKNSKFYRFLLYSWTWIALRLLRIKVHITGMEKLPKDGRFVFVGNHISNYDPIITWYALRKYDLAFISKESNFNIPIFGRIIRKCCFMSIDRANPKNAVKTITRASGLIKADEVSMAVYPEGTRNKTQHVLLPFHNVVFKIAQKPQVPIVVASTYGTNKIAGRTPFRRTHVYLDILNVLSTEEVLQSRTAEIGSTVTRIITENLEKYTIGEKDEKLLHIV